MSVDVLVWYQRSFTVASCNALHLYQSIRLSFGRYNVHFFQPLFEKVSNYACHIPWPCFQLFTFHSRSRGAPPLLWRRGGLALCWSMLLATKMGSSRPPQMFWFQSCFDFQVLTYWLLRSLSVCVCMWHQRFRELSNPRSFEAPLLLCIRRHDTYCALYDIHSIIIVYNHPAPFFLELRLLPTILCRGCRIRTAINIGKLLFHWCGGQGVKTARVSGFGERISADIQRFCETSRCTSVLAPRETLISSCIWPPGSSPHEVQAVRLVDRNDTLRRSQWSVLEDVGPIWLGCSRVSGRTNQMFRSQPAVIDLLLKFRIWHHVMSCVVILSLLVNKKLRQQWCLGTFMKHLKISRHPLLLELLADSADQQMDSWHVTISDNSNSP